MITKKILDMFTRAFKEKHREGLQTLWNEINQGQQKQIIKKETIKELFDLYGVNY